MLLELDGTEEIVFNLSVRGEKLWVPVDTAALSIWVDHHWLLRIGRRITPSEIRADAVDGHHLDVRGEGHLTFELRDMNSLRKFNCCAIFPTSF